MLATTPADVLRMIRVQFSGRFSSLFMSPPGVGNHRDLRRPPRSPDLLGWLGAGMSLPAGAGRSRFPVALTASASALASGNSWPAAPVIPGCSVTLIRRDP